MGPAARRGRIVSDMCFYFNLILCSFNYEKVWRIRNSHKLWSLFTRHVYLVPLKYRLSNPSHPTLSKRALKKTDDNLLIPWGTFNAFQWDFNFTSFERLIFIQNGLVTRHRCSFNLIRYLVSPHFTSRRVQNIENTSNSNLYYRIGGLVPTSNI